MKRFVDGEEITLAGDGAEIRSMDDRMFVRTVEGTFSAVAVRVGESTLVSYKGRQYKIERKLARTRTGRTATGELHAPMPGLIVDVLVAEGASVKKGQKLLVLEAMKTQQPFVAPFDGKVSRLLAQKGEQVAEGALLALVEEGE